MRLTLILLTGAILAVGARMAYPVFAEDPAGGDEPSPAQVRSDEQISVSPEDVAVGGDGRLTIADRGDGCLYNEVARGRSRLHRMPDSPLEEVDVVVLQAEGCDVFYWFLPSDRTVHALIAIGAPQ